MATIRIGGKELEGRSITIVVGREIALRRTKAEPGESFMVHVDGDLAVLSSNGSVVMQGDVHGSVNAGRDLTCDEVGGNVRAGRDVRCEDVDGSVSAGGDVACGAVHGQVGAGGRVDWDTEATV